MSSLDPNDLRGCPGFAFSIQLWFVQTTDETSVDELRWSTLRKKRCLKGRKTNR